MIQCCLYAHLSTISGYKAKFIYNSCLQHVSIFVCKKDKVTAIVYTMVLMSGQMTNPTSQSYNSITNCMKELQDKLGEENHLPFPLRWCHISIYQFDVESGVQVLHMWLAQHHPEDRVHWQNFHHKLLHCHQVRPVLQALWVQMLWKLNLTWCPWNMLF